MNFPKSNYPSTLFQRIVKVTNQLGVSVLLIRTIIGIQTNNYFCTTNSNNLEAKVSLLKLIHEEQV